MIRFMRRIVLLAKYALLESELEDATTKCMVAARKLARAERWEQQTSDALERVRRRLEET